MLVGGNKGNLTEMENGTIQMGLQTKKAYLKKVNLLARIKRKVKGKAQ